MASPSQQKNQFSQIIFNFCNCNNSIIFVKIPPNDALILVTLIALKLLNFIQLSSVKWSDPGYFLKAQGKFIFSFPCTLFLHIFDT